MKQKILSLISACTLFACATPVLALTPCSGLRHDNIYFGPVLCGNGVMSDLTVRGGPVVMNGTTVDNQTNIAGPLAATDSKFAGLLTIATDILTLSNSKAANITIKSVAKTQSLYLKEGTVISGDVTFQGDNGTVYLSGNSKVDGKVIGGKIAPG